MIFVLIQVISALGHPVKTVTSVCLASVISHLWAGEDHFYSLVSTSP